MGVELLRQADMVLDQCGRPSPPAGVKFVDLPRVLSYAVAFDSSPGDPNFIPVSQRVQNKANTLFLVEGIQADGPVSFRIKWPSGRSFSQNPMTRTVEGASPLGRGAGQYKLRKPEPIAADGRITVESFGPVGELQLRIWGKLRYLVQETGKGAGAVSCIVGYPADARESRDGSRLPMMKNPVRDLEDLALYQSCRANGNIMAPEYMLGNQCTFETPAGLRDSSYSFASDAFVVAENQLSLNNPVIVPGPDQVVLQRVRAMTTWQGGADALLSFSLRTPNGYSWSGGDLVAQAGIQWFYFFPELVVNSGDRLILDLGNYDATAADPSRTLTTRFEFEGKRRKADTK